MSVSKGTASPRVAVVGDFMLDVYVKGSVNRVCPDAPAPVLAVEGELLAAGGAGNVAIGCSAHGLEVVACGVIGDDSAARALETLLAESGVRLDGLVAADARTTLVKRRFCCNGQVLLRADDGSAYDDSGHVAGKLDGLLGHVDALIVADYGYGSVSEEARQLIEARRRQRDRELMLVDSRLPGRYRSTRPDVVKPNYAEMLALLHEGPRPDRVEHVFERREQLLEATGASAVVVTLDADGAALVTRDGRRHCPAPAARGTSTSGAGDTFLAVLASGLLSHLSIEEATGLATRAATAACGSGSTASALTAEQPAHRDKRVAPEAVAAWAQRMRAEGRRVVLTNGCFDIFHSGHADFLQAAAAAGDALLVAVNTDEGVRRLKGEERPVNHLEDRLRVLEAIGVVSAVTWFDERTAAEVARRARPDVYVKGSDYRGLSFPEADLVRGYGGRVVFVDLLEGRSTTAIVARVRGKAGVAG